MKLSLQKGLEAINEYINGNVSFPFLVAVDGSADIARILSTLPNGFSTVMTSDFCQNDSYPDYDKLLETIVASEKDTVLLGLGECSMFSLNYGFWGKIKDTPRAAKTIVILRNGSEKCKELQKVDSKFNANRWCEIDSLLDISAVRVDLSVKIDAIQGFKAFLNKLEANKAGKHYVQTNLPLANSMFIRNSYGVVRDREPAFSISEHCLSSNQWDEYIANSKLDGYPLVHWRTYLSILLNGTTSPYMKLVMRYSPTYEEYENAIFFAILSIDCKTQNYKKYYDERKAILHDFPEYKFLEYVHSSKIKDKDRIFYLTDSTRAERRAIVEEISHIGAVPKELSWIYPDLYSYLKLYRFSGENTDFFTDYFEQYKVQKVTNLIADSFLETVMHISEPGKRMYNALPSRNSLLMQFTPSNCGLYWIDALGVEYLAFIQSKAKDLGLRISVNISRSMLPTLTNINRGFFDDWVGYKAKKNPHLDKLKHEGIGDAGTKSTDPAVHLADELEVITEAMVQIKEVLTSHTVDAMLLVSDHGASRLCVLNQFENKWEMQEKGVHSGRCCKTSEIDEQPQFATESQGFWVLANYDRFKGSMPANVEVHGGASLEEVIVPIIEFTLASQEIGCSVIGEQDDEGIVVIKKPLDSNAVLEVYCPKSNTTLSARIRGKDYVGVPDKSNRNKFAFELKGQFLVGSTYSVTFFEQDNELNTVQFRLVRQKGANKNKKDGTDFFA